MSVNRTIIRPRPTGKSKLHVQILAAMLGISAPFASSRVKHPKPRPAHQLQPQARERARRIGGAVWEAFKAADRARRGLPAKE